MMFLLGQEPVITPKLRAVINDGFDGRRKEVRKVHFMSIPEAEVRV